MRLVVRYHTKLTIHQGSIVRGNIVSGWIRFRTGWVVSDEAGPYREIVGYSIYRSAWPIYREIEMVLKSNNNDGGHTNKDTDANWHTAFEVMASIRAL